MYAATTAARGGAEAAEERRSESGGLEMAELGGARELSAQSVERQDRPERWPLAIVADSGTGALYPAR